MTLNKSTLSEQIYHILRNDILTQKIHLGEKLTLASLKERFDVSTTPIREALTRLSEEGLLNYFSNVGVKVISLSLEDLIELYQFMGDLDRLAILYSANHPHREEIIAELGKILSITSRIEEKEILDPEDIPEWISYSDRFHLLFYDYANNSRLTHAAEKLRSQLTIFSNLYETDTQAQRKINQSHSEIFKLYKNGEIEKAGNLMKDHLNDSLQFALKKL